MRTSVKDDENFIKELIPSSLLEDAINFITSNFGAEEVYGKEALIEWAKKTGIYLRSSGDKISKT